MPPREGPDRAGGATDAQIFRHTAWLAPGHRICGDVSRLLRERILPRPSRPQDPGALRNAGTARASDAADAAESAGLHPLLRLACADLACRSRLLDALSYEGE